MCNPMAIISVVQTASQISKQNQAAERSQQAAVEKQQVMQAQRVQEQEDTNRKAALELTDRKREALQEQASMRTAAAESGVAGKTPLLNLANVYMQESIDAGSIISETEAKQVTIGRQMQKDYLEAKSDIAIAESKKTTGLSAALQIGVAGAQGYGAQGGFDKGATLGSEWGKTTSLFK